MLTSFTAIDHNKLKQIDENADRLSGEPRTRIRFSLLPHRIAARNAR
ncbi:hypothetical protein [Fulvimarina sp. MAC8]